MAISVTPATLPSYLRLRGVASSGAVCQGQWDVSTHSGRNQIFFLRAGSLQLTVKQAGDGRPDKLRCLIREAEWYWLAQNDPRFQSLTPLLPSVYSWDPERYIFVMETLPGKSIPTLPRQARFHPMLARRLGEAMALVHDQCAAIAAAPDLQNHFLRALPTFLNAPQTARESATDSSLSLAQKEYLTVLRNHPEFDPPLAELRQSWRGETLIHSDWKIANCLADPAHPEAMPHIIDWELVRRGDSLWDAATLLQSYWMRWVEQPLEWPLEEIRPALQGFWSAYAGARRWSEEEAAANRLRAVSLAGARMLQTIWEYTVDLPALAPMHIRMLQLSLNILQHPATATREFFPS